MREDRGGIESRDFSTRDMDRGDRGVRQSDQAFRREGQQSDQRNLRGRLDDTVRRDELGFVDRDGRGREFRGGDFDRDYQRWRDNVWTGVDRRGRDDRDWSGRWRDGGRFDVARDVRRWWGDRDWDDDGFPFRFGWWGGRNWYGHRWDHWDNLARSRPFYWWYWATAPRLSNWIAFRWGTPYYWDYGPGEYIYYDDGGIYVNGRWYQAAPVYYDSTVRIVDQAPQLTVEEAARVEWLPLGVFAVTRDGQSEPDALVQLAVTQDGVIGGTSFEQRTGATYPVEGTVEKQSQRAIWSYTDARSRRVVMETSIFNLTQPEATGLAQYGPENMQVVELVRLEAPESSVASRTAAPTGELPPPAAR
jgi:hypothetical protein